MKRDVPGEAPEAAAEDGEDQKMDQQTLPQPISAAPSPPTEVDAEEMSDVAQEVDLADIESESEGMMLESGLLTQTPDDPTMTNDFVELVSNEGQPGEDVHARFKLV